MSKRVWQFTMAWVGLLVLGSAAPVLAQDHEEADEATELLKEGLPLMPERTLSETFTEGSWISLDISPDGQAIVFDLLGDLWAHVEGADDRAQRLRGADGGQSGDTGPDHQHLGRRDLTGSGHLSGEKAAEVIPRLDHRTVARDICHGAECVHLLSARNPWNHIHRDHTGPLCSDFGHLRFVLRRIKERNQCFTFCKALCFRCIWRADFGNDIRAFP